MTEYLIRTDKGEKKTYIVKIGKPLKNIGVIYTDFQLHQGIRDITLDDVVDPSNNKQLANVRLYWDGNVVSVNKKNRELSALSVQGEYKEKGIIIPYRKLAKAALLANEGYKALEEMGVTHAYFIGEKSPITRVFCFERDGDVSGIIYARNNTTEGIGIPLKGLTLVLAERIQNQEYILEFLRK